MNYKFVLKHTANGRRNDAMAVNLEITRVLPDDTQALRVGEQYDGTLLFGVSLTLEGVYYFSDEMAYSHGPSEAWILVLA